MYISIIIFASTSGLLLVLIVSIGWYIRIWIYDSLKYEYKINIIIGKV